MKRTRTEYIILHTAAWPGDPSIHDIHRVHVDQNGWNDVGYHYVIRKDGTIEVGRHEMQQGAHCRDMGMNSQSIGICLSGHHDREDITGAQRKSLMKLCKQVMDAHDIPSAKVWGHRETGAKKSCPGEMIDMDLIRHQLKNYK